ncbi:MAG: TIGR02147 family protein [Polyangiaceae bacterium]|nr:TIGR02147 family protein [Polyangiaceae bacterium]
MAVRKSLPRRRETGVSVFEFLDYRAFLRASYEAGKKTRAGLSFRTISRRAGLRSPNFFKLVMDGHRNLGAESVPKFADALGPEGAERDFFADLAAFEHARDSAEKNRIFERIAASRRFRTARRIDGMLLTYLSHWYQGRRERHGLLARRGRRAGGGRGCPARHRRGRLRSGRARRSGSDDGRTREAARRLRPRRARYDCGLCPQGLHARPGKQGRRRRVDPRSALGQRGQPPASGLSRRRRGNGQRRRGAGVGTGAPHARTRGAQRRDRDGR